jgi:hypothetical protein
VTIDNPGYCRGIYTPIRSAYQEAGHAVAAILMDLPLRHVTLRPSEREAPRCELAMTREEISGLVNQTPKYLSRYLTLVLAGHCAEALIAPPIIRSTASGRLRTSGRLCSGRPTLWVQIRPGRR